MRIDRAKCTHVGVGNPCPNYAENICDTIGCGATTCGSHSYVCFTKMLCGECSHKLKLQLDAHTREYLTKTCGPLEPVG